MIEVLRSAVNTWECDQMGHMNVRHYFGRANQGLAMLLLELGLPPTRLRSEGLALRAREQHVRFMRELRPGVAYTVRAGIVAANGHGLHVYEQMDIAHSGEVAASVLSEVALVELATGRESPYAADLVQRARTLLTSVPEAYAPRGIERTPPRPPPLRAEAIERGMYGAYLGPVLQEDVDAAGRMQEAAFMARVADGIGHYFLALRGEREHGMGGAALEYRYVFHQRPTLGDIIEVRSGLKGVGSKTSHICHWIFDVESGRCVATSEAVAVSFDLTTRRAVPIPDELRAQMVARVLPDLSV
jgi:acyl-CoA thioester hydrolase